MQQKISAKPHFQTALRIKKDGCGVSFIHSSDVHLSVFPAPLLGEYAPGNDSINKSFCQHLQQWVDAGLIDIVLVTGDLANTGVRRNIKKAEWFVYGNARILERGALEIFPIPLPEGNIAFMPGNHDRYRENMKGRLPTNDIFYDVFSNRWPKGKKVSTFPIIDIADSVKVFLVMADFTLDRSEVRGNDLAWIKYRHKRIPHKYRTDSFDELASYLAQGEAYEDRVDALVSETIRLKCEYDCEVLWGVHFPPFFPGISGAMCLVGEELFTEKAGELDIKIIFCGHTHQFNDYALDNKNQTRVLCAPSLSKATPGGSEAGFYFFSLEMNANRELLIHKTKYRWSRLDGRFNFV